MSFTILLVIRKIQIKITVRYHFIPNRNGNKRDRKDNWWHRCREMGILIIADENVKWCSPGQVAQLVVTPKFMGSIPGQGIYLGVAGPIPSHREYRKQLIDVSLSLSHSTLVLSLKSINMSSGEDFKIKCNKIKWYRHFEKPSGSWKKTH